ncbi:hydroxyacid dehydrogenase [Tumebacillus flagellatus]|uniref:3-phosphoglycerate dehydrogenase n=1 Tax=Tumebacillus flagellatus TaxID=1157490 RepID=A0A074MGS2_9BACL|nr:hydroxyacid dehydrogenase [Tumebacillus flagellatus]KEO84927.1 hypothetical protein EL26_02655 [Tumebacillus flagellatus]
MEVIIAEDLWGPVPDWFLQKWAVVYDHDLGLDPARLTETCSQAKALVVRNRTQVNRELIEHLPNLRVVGRLGVGVENLDLDALAERGVSVVTARGANANAVAEYVIAALFEHARFLGRLSGETKQGQWNRASGIGRELHGKTLGLIGFGEIGQRVASRAHALGLEIIAYDPLLHPAHPAVHDGGVRQKSLADVCREADYLSLHVPLTANTRHLIGAAEFASMKREAVLINTARGGVVDESALLHSLQEHPHRFAVLDVREHEPPSQPDALAQLPNVLLTPHIAGLTHESQAQVTDRVLRELHTLLQIAK